MTATTVPDVHELLGLRTTAARLLVAAYVVSFALVAANTSPAGALWNELTAWLIVSLASIALIVVRGERLPLAATVALTASAVVAANVIFVVSHPPVSGLQLWPLSAATVIYTFMCVRGRALWAWVGMIAVLISYMIWAERTGLGWATGPERMVANFGALLIATFFAWKIRPASRQIFELRRQTTLRVAAEAADTAVLEERDTRLAELEALARPLLERLAGDRPLTDDVRRESLLLEAHLRDTLRAPTLATPEISDSASRTRSRGVEVVMLDDHGLGGAPVPVRDLLLARVVDALAAADSGTLTIRILPPGRDALLTILHSTSTDVTRLEYGLDGQLIHPR